MTEPECCGGNCGCAQLAASTAMVGWVPLPDVSGQTLAELAEKKVQMARATERLVRSLDDPNGVISAFSSFVE